MTQFSFLKKWSIFVKTETIRFKSYSPLKYFIQVSTKSSIIFSIFIKSCIFFSIYTILNKTESGTIRVDSYFPFVKSTYGSNYVVFSFHFQWFILLLWNILDKCQSWTIRFNPHSPFSSVFIKNRCGSFALYLQKFSVNLYQETIPFEWSCPFKDSQ